MADSKRNIVFSTDSDYLKKRQEQEQEKECGQESKQHLPVAYIQREKKSRGGKVVSVISNLSGELKALQKELQKLCATGGTLKDGKIEIQGDHRDRIAEYLKQKGFKVKLIGG